MVITVLAIVIMLASAALVVQQMSSVAQDAAGLVKSGFWRALRRGGLAAQAALALLTAIIFVLSYL